MSDPVSPSPEESVMFLLSQLGAHVSGTFTDRLIPLGLKPYQAGILSVIERKPGLTQQALADLLGVFPSRLVAMLDELGEAKLIERRASPTDRRTYALHLTKGGVEARKKIGKMAGLMEDDLCVALNEKERKALAALLGRIVDQQKITPGVHPGFRQMEKSCGPEESSPPRRAAKRKAG